MTGTTWAIAAYGIGLVLLWGYVAALWIAGRKDAVS
jgi:hypothetical protein